MKTQFPTALLAIISLVVAAAIVIPLYLFVRQTLHDHQAVEQVVSFLNQQVAASQQQNAAK